MVFVGGNDGMLHAAKLGTLVLTDTDAVQKASLVNSADGYNLGDEKWAYIPKQVLPYLAYIADPDYCHLYTVDLTPIIFDASINGNPTDNKTASSWKTVLIGGMRWGGACRKTGTACNSKACNVTTGTSCTTSADCPSGEACDPNCVNTPITDPGSASKGLGYSAYFALDVTNQNSPSLLWEFSEADLPSGKGLGFSTTGPAIVRVGNKKLNGSWFVVFGSGPTGPIDVNNYQFLGRSDQALQYHVLDLKTGAYKATITPGISDAFSGSLSRGAVDIDQDYQDDAVYVGYVKKCTNSLLSPCTTNTWSDGGIGAIITHNDAHPENNTWTWRSVVSNLGPVTSAVDNLWDPGNKLLWLYTGTGRYFYEQSTTTDDSDNQRYIIGLKDPCCDTSTSPSCLDNTCSVSRSLSDLTNVTNVANAPAVVDANQSSFKGWKVALDGTGSYTYSPDPAANFRAERVVTDTTTMTSGNVMFVSYKPYADECGVGGKSFLWGIRYNTGGAPGSSMIGNALLQTSTGAITQLDFYNQFTAAGGRKTGSSVEGYSSEDPPSTVTPLAPLKKQMHLIER
jgi:type IV pilus assembly protein PilY1